MVSTKKPIKIGAKDAWKAPKMLLETIRADNKKKTTKVGKPLKAAMKKAASRPGTKAIMDEVERKSKLKRGGTKALMDAVQARVTRSATK